jgi:hypothetical protein
MQNNKKVENRKRLYRKGLYRKGFLTDPLVDAFAFIALITIVVVFGVVFNIIQSSGAFVITDMEINMDAEAELLQILRAPVEIEGYRTDIAGYIIYANGNKSRTDRLKIELEKLFENTAAKTSTNCFLLQINDYPEQYAVFEAGASEKKEADACTYGTTTVELQLPGHSRTYDVVFRARTDKAEK